MERLPSQSKRRREWLAGRAAASRTQRPAIRVWVLLAIAAVTLAGAPQIGAAQAPETPNPQSTSPPDDPQPRSPRPQKDAKGAATTPCPAANGTTQQAGTGDDARATQSGAKPEAGVNPCAPKKLAIPPIDWFARFLNGPEVKPMTVEDKGRLAVRNLVDPFNLITILGASGISVAADSHSAYGPGMAGFGRSVGVSFTQDLTNNFFNVFLIPSIVHQDPHYHRWPNRTIRRRVLHCILQTVWTRGDNRERMLNYGNLLGDAIDDEIGNLYIPGRRTNAAATAERYGVDLATAPIDNAITEFLPDFARRIHVHVVFIQRIINTVAKTPGTGSGGQ